MAERTEIQKAQEALTAAALAYDKKTHTPTQKMTPAQKLAHARACQESYRVKKEAAAVLDAAMKNEPSRKAAGTQS